MEEDAFPALFAETYLLPPDSRTAPRPIQRRAVQPQLHFAHLIPRITHDVRAAWRSVVHLH